MAQRTAGPDVDEEDEADAADAAMAVADRNAEIEGERRDMDEKEDESAMMGEDGSDEPCETSSRIPIIPAALLLAADARCSAVRLLILLGGWSTSPPLLPLLVLSLVLLWLLALLLSFVCCRCSPSSLRFAATAASAMEVGGEGEAMNGGRGAGGVELQEKKRRRSSRGGSACVSPRRVLCLSGLRPFLLLSLHPAQARSQRLCVCVDTLRAEV